MKLVQFFLPGKGQRVGLVRGERVLDISAPEEGVRSALDLVVQGKTAAGLTKRAEWLARRLRRKALDWPALQRPPSRRAPHLMIPIEPPEVWGAGVTYKRSAEFRDEDAGAATGAANGQKGIYDHVYESPRPELFFKATAARCVGPHTAIRVRSDSHLTATEPELAIVLGARGAIVGFMACNDVSAWDIERENPLFLPQSKIYLGCCALGPCLVTPDEIRDPYALQIRCSILRDDKTVFSEAVNTSQFHRRLEDLVSWLLRDNVIPPGTVLTTGTGIMVPNELALRDGDQVDIEIQGIGRLSNPVKQLKGN
ncbi:MAG TPA: fumarylacetoacetate hydrolase family protein [Candidatus Methylomirabilis sp.]|nr:fumarylacetoacetate hydrolase family protein [Candidatus Methylomirabilis sp.]